MSEGIGGLPGRPHTPANSSATCLSSSSSLSSEILALMPGSTREGRGLDAGVAQRLADGGRDLACARGVAVDADRVDAARTGRAQRLLRGKVGVEDRSGLVARRQRAVGQHQPVGEPLAIAGNAGPLRRRDDLEARLADHPDVMRLGDAGQRVSGGRVPLAPVVQRAVRLDVRDGSDRGEARHLESDERFDLVRAKRTLDATESRAVVVAGMSPHLQAQSSAPPGRGDGDRRRARMYPARDVGAVDRSEHGLVLGRALPDVRVDVHSCLVWPCRSWIACPRTGIVAARDSVAPFLLPGTLRMSAWPRTPAPPPPTPATPVLASPARRISSTIPGTS